MTNNFITPSWLLILVFSPIIIMYLIDIYKNPRRIGNEYLTRWFIIPRNRFFNIYLHKYTGSDDDRALHDHPWHSVSFLIWGSLHEVTPDILFLDYGRWLNVTKSKKVKKFLPKYRSAKYAHRLELESKTAWTIFLTGPKVRSWGFHCPKGWRPWREFTDESGNGVGQGCD